MDTTASSQKILTIDIGGSHIKGTVLNEKGELLMPYKKEDTPAPSTPENVINTIKELAQNFPDYQKVSVGFPGYVREGIVFTAPNLGSEHWQGVDLSKQLSDVLGKPVRVVNDADLQGAGVARGKGLEMVVTLGTGFGTALLMNGQLLPHLELAHHPITKNKTYDEYIGEKALQDIGKGKWNKRMKKVIEVLKTVFNYDRLYISGGNADELDFQLDSNITIVTNKDGIKGGAKLWQQNS